MKKKELKRDILKIFGDREFYGYELHKKLSALGVKIEISRLYRILNEMLKEELLEGRWEKSYLGPKKRVYKIGEKGREELNKILLSAIKTVHGFYAKYIIGLPTQTNPINNISSLLVKDLKEGTLGYLIGRYSGMHEIIIRQINNYVPKTIKYFIKPPSLKMKLKLENLIMLNGTYNDISFRDNYLDLLIIIDLPSTNLLEESFAEWHRVVKQHGKIAIITPTILINNYRDPLTIGNYIEKYEHERIEKGEYINKKHLQKILKNYFKKIEEKEIIHMTIFLASQLKGINIHGNA
jgi:PadR family transcriptional regulator PadR